MVETDERTAIWLISGGRGAGKTTLCGHVADLARRADWDVAGILSPARVENGDKTGIFVQDLRRRESRLLASAKKDEATGMHTCRWTFSEAALHWANEALAGSVPCDLLVIDEIGPLELEQEKGLVAWRGVLRSKLYRIALAVVRPELEQLFREEWRHSPSLVIDSPGQAMTLAQTFAFDLIQR